MTDQIKLLNDLARKISAAKRTKKQSMETLMNAKILNKNGKLTSHYSHLGKLVAKAG